jgi:hypothetical protein
MALHQTDRLAEPSLDQPSLDEPAGGGRAGRGHPPVHRPLLRRADGRRWRWGGQCPPVDVLRAMNGGDSPSRGFGWLPGLTQVPAAWTGRCRGLHRGGNASPASLWFVAAFGVGVAPGVRRRGTRRPLGSCGLSGPRARTGCTSGTCTRVDENNPAAREAGDACGGPVPACASPCRESRGRAASGEVETDSERKRYPGPEIASIHRFRTH